MIAVILPGYAYSPTTVLANLASYNSAAPGKPEFEPDQVLVRLRSTSTISDPQPVLAKASLRNRITKAKLEVKETNLYHLYLAPHTNLDDFISQLRKEPDVIYAEPNYIFHLLDLRSQPAASQDRSFKIGKSNLTPNDPLNASQYYLDATSIKEAWNLTTGSKLIVAVEDSGVRKDHPDLAGRIRSDGFNFVSNTDNVNDDLGHGTEVTGLIAANSNNNIGIAGISWAAQILPVKIANNQGIIDANAASEGIYYAVQHGAKVLNLSYGGENASTSLAEAVAYALDNQVTVIAAAGNAPDGATEYPAAFPGVIAVTATDASDKLAFFDSYGRYVSLSAPGMNIYTTGINQDGRGDYSSHSGTSFSSPIVAGTAALMLSLNPYLRPGQILNALINTADKTYPRDPEYYSNYGSGRLNALKALQFVRTLPVVPLPKVSYADIIFFQHLSPNKTVAVDDYLSLQISAVNYGTGPARSAYLNVPIAPGLNLQYVVTKPGKTNEWVTAVYPDYFRIQLGPIAPADTITFTAVFKVNKILTGSLISFPLTGYWSDDGAGGSNHANFVSVVVSNTSSDNPLSYNYVDIAPSNGTIGQTFKFSTDGFAAGEPVSLWLNLPDGSVKALTIVRANSNGEVSYLFTPNNSSQSGVYSIVAYGQASHVELVGRFNVNRN